MLGMTSISKQNIFFLDVQRGLFIGLLVQLFKRGDRIRLPKDGGGDADRVNVVLFKRADVVLTDAAIHANGE